MKTLSILIGVVQCLSVTFAASSESSRDLPVYEVARVEQPLQIDGKLQETAWRGIAEMAPFVNNTDGATSPLKTWSGILWDNEYLYFGFQIWDDNIWATFTERDQHLWLEEVVEVFLQGSPDSPSYIELEVNPLGTMLDIFLLDIRKPIKYESWNSSRLRWAVQVDGTVDGEAGDRSWSCEIALPLEDVVTAPRIPPAKGDEWRLNLYRVEKKPAQQGLAWSPTLKPDFHVPVRFGRIVFTDKVIH